MTKEKVEVKVKVEEKKEEMGIDLKVLNIFSRYFSSMFRDEESEGVWFNKDYFIMVQSEVKNLRWTPKHQIFKKEFGISSLPDFIKILKIMDKVSIKYELPKILLKDKEKRIVIEISTSPESSFGDE